MPSDKPASTVNDGQQDNDNVNSGYKEQLDEAAGKIKYPDESSNGVGMVGQVVEKISQYVPAVGKIVGNEKGGSPSEGDMKVPGPPERPHHDTQIEEFVRDQHRSKKEDGTLTDE